MAPALVENVSSTANGPSAPTKPAENIKVAVSEVEDQNKDLQGHWVPKSDDDLGLLAIRNLVLDMTMQNGGGHGGSAVGMAAIGLALWKHTMRYNPNNPDWFDRDRFILSNGWCRPPHESYLRLINNAKVTRACFCIQ